MEDKKQTPHTAELIQKLVAEIKERRAAALDQYQEAVEVAGVDSYGAGASFGKAYAYRWVLEWCDANVSCLKKLDIS